MATEFSRITILFTICISTAFAGSPAGGNYPDPSNPFVRAYLQTQVQAPITQEADSAMLAMRQMPGYRYPGRALMYSLAVPGGGQFYLGQWKRALIYLALEGIAIAGRSRYAKEGKSQVTKNKSYANENWDFSDWIRNANGFGLPGSEEIDFGANGSHSLDFYVDNDLDGQPEIIGSTGDSSQAQMLDLVFEHDGFIFVKKNGEYYENIGKYNQFHTGWDDYDSSWVEPTKSGVAVHSLNRDYYLKKRRAANRLLSAASYTLSALMFNHVISGVDAIFSSSRKNRKLFSNLHGSLLYQPENPGGIGGIRLSIDL
ncbi:hypothetical protein ACFL6E_00875 [Candidatus Neomarinimicrobiota bacterium]